MSIFRRRPNEREIAALLERGHRYALSLTHDEASAEDLVQDAWLSALRAGRSGHVGYLMATIRNRYIDTERRRRLVVIDSRESADTIDEPHAMNLDADRYVEAINLERALSALRDEEREALYLAAVEGYTAREIGVLQGRPAGTVSSVVARARKKLRALVLGKGTGSAG